MILPASYVTGLLLMVVALLCLGSWASTFKAAGRWRYELYYFDLSIGFLLCAVVAALTLGSLRSSELTFQDNLLITSYRKMIYAFAAGLIFNLGNVILLAGISVGGLALCLPAVFGLALAINATWDFILDPRPNPLLLVGGLVFVLGAIALLSLAYVAYRKAVQESSRKALELDPRSKQAKRRPKQAATGVAIVFGIISGIIVSFAPRVLTVAAEGENGVAAYGAIVLFGAGLLFSTFLYSPFVIAFPVGNTPVSIADYFRATRKQHLLGILGGGLLAAGLLTASAVKGSPASALLGTAWIAGLEQAAPLVAALWGLFVFKEFRGATERVRSFLWGGFILYAVGVALVALAPLYGAH
jgi:glucose uptake protein